MTDRIEKAYCLRQEELAVLLAMQGVTQLYGFRMDNFEDMSQEALHRILFEMAKKKLLFICDDRVRIDAGLSEILKHLAKAMDIWILTGREEYPECCIYAGQKLVFVNLLGRSGQIYRMELMEKKEACLKIREYGFQVPGVLGKIQTVPQDAEEFLWIRQLAEEMYDWEKENVMRHERVNCSLIQYSVVHRRKVQQLLIMNGVLEDYLALSDKEQSQVYVYSDAKADELLQQMIGGRV